MYFEGSVSTKAPATRPTKATNKPTKYSVTTNKPASSTVKVTKKPTFLTKPTKRTAATTKRKTVKPITTSTTTKPPTVTTVKSSKSTTKTTTFSTITEPKVTTMSPSPIDGSTNDSTTLAPIEQTTRIQNETTTRQPDLVTTLSNEVTIEKSNASQVLETVNGNPATNEIEGGRPVEPVGPPVNSEPTDKPGISRPVGALIKNGFFFVTEWVPITTPDGWVLLPSVAPVNSPDGNKTDSHSTTIIPLEVQTVLQSSSSTASSMQEPSTELPERPTEHAFTTIFPSILNTTAVSAPTEVSETELPSSELPSTESPPVSTATTSDMSNIPVNMSDFTHVCGRRMFPEARIVGGEKSSFGKWPWQISLRQWRTSTYLHKCGAALLNENWAITAAHCVDNVPPSDLLLRLGEHDLSTESEPYLHQERRVQIVASHPQFDPRTFEYDLALLRFYEPVVFQPNILPVCVPQTDENFVGRTAWVTGWGRLYEDGPLPSVLQEVSVPVINNTVCESMYRAAGYIEHIPHIFICAGWRRGGFDSCEGDSGGPMVIQRDDNRFLLAGVISWGIGCAEPNQPGVYTRISEFRDWINQILQF
ncbi:unnamed protein product [Phaedon cochleariae]|uniref:Peptidase S1 domain-containing protein n=1 Tax=Phaedon cochleariae TaxID=80249 RepID=A0A9N9SI08_PHACE|nr:unnamed protein product [Phaedon cochleariae]